MSRSTYRGNDTAAPWRTWIPPVSVPSQQEEDLHVLLWQVRGEAVAVVADEERSVSAGHALWVPVGTRHEFTVQANSVTMPVFFVAEDIATTLREPLLVPVDRDLRTLLLAYTVSWNTIVQPPTDLARQVLALIEDRPVLSSALPLPTGGPALAIAQTLRFNPGDNRSVEELAESVHTSSRTVERAFRAETRMTLRRWRIHNRMEAAAVLLRSNPTLDAVAHRVGYSNVNSFRRAFKAHVGISPTEYVNRYTSQ